MKHDPSMFAVLLLGSTLMAAPAEGACSNATLRGTYGFYRVGFTAANSYVDPNTNATAPCTDATFVPSCIKTNTANGFTLASVGSITFDGQGTASALEFTHNNSSYTVDSTSDSQTLSLSPMQPQPHPYRVNRPNCTFQLYAGGAIPRNGSTAGLVVVADGVIVDGGRQYYMLARSVLKTVLIVATRE